MGLLVLMSIVSTPKVWTSLSLPDAGIVPTFAVVTLCVVLQPNLGERAAAQKVDDTQQMLCGAHTMCRAAAKPGYSRGLPCWGAAGLEPFPPTEVGARRSCLLPHGTCSCTGGM